MDIGLNGCSCAQVRAKCRDDGDPKPPEWKCISCVAREKLKNEGHICRKCGTGIHIDSEERDNKGLCTACFYEE